MSAWRHEPFEGVIVDESGGNAKTPQGEFLPAGRYAIVDQGKELIAGYTNDESRLCHAQLPVIVFGDHTRLQVRGLSILHGRGWREGAPP